jgi:type I restriction enzyme M protein
MKSFSECKAEFDNTLGKGKHLSTSMVPVHGTFKKNIKIRGGIGAKPLEEYYKWQCIYSLINSGLYSKDDVGVEVHFPKGSKGANPLKIDGAIFDDSEWLERYKKFWKSRRTEDLQWLNEHLIAAIEFKRDLKNPKNIEEVVQQQLKPAMKEKEPSDGYVLGIYYDTGRLYLFHRRNGKYLRYDEAKNQKNDQSKLGDLSLHLPDPFAFISAFDELILRINRPSLIDRSVRGVNDLDIITSISTVQMGDSLSDVLRQLSRDGLFNQRGYEILIKTLALKIFDEKRNQRNPSKNLEFYIEEQERHFASLGENPIQCFINRMMKLWKAAAKQYSSILQAPEIDWKDPAQVRVVISVCVNFQDYSFVRSAKSDLYQLVFYNFANKFQQQEKAQFLTHLPVIDFLVKIVNPRNGETVFDPCCGIGDFLSLSFVNSLELEDRLVLDDANIYGADLSQEMITLASLNMLLNGDGDAHLFCVPPDMGSILYKIKIGRQPDIVELLPSSHKAGDWDNWPDKTELFKFDVVLTNPPFGRDRAFRPTTDFGKQVIEMYETWSLSGGDSIDLGVVFLENACRCLADNGRLGIVLSNSIASINEWKEVREWFMDRMRIVALFDLPSNVFAETGVNTTLLVAYKPCKEELAALNNKPYSIFVRDIQNVGYEKQIKKRNVVFNKTYKFDEETFEVRTDEFSSPIVNEDFSRIIEEFHEWAVGQEETVKRLFLEDKR